MFTYFNHQKKQTLFSTMSKVIVCILSLSLVFSPSAVYAQSMNLLNLPTPGTMVLTSSAFNPAIITGIKIYPDNPLQFDFIIDIGDNQLQGEALKKESQKLINYFMATLTVPEDEMWVNLSPYEKDRIIAQGLSHTEMGRDMLAQDYLLKQLTASLMYPEDDFGKEFWNRVYSKTQAKYGTTEIPMNTFNKIWIVPDAALVYVHDTNAFVIENHLKVMLEEDYLALESNVGSAKHGLGNITKDDIEVVSGASAEIIREVLLPEIEKEVNEGKNFANLRQMYNSMLLATWYKKNLKESLLGQVYVGKNKVNGIELDDKEMKQKIYDRYVEAFEKGVYNYIKGDIDSVTQEVIPRKYFSGGVDDYINNGEERFSVIGGSIPGLFVNRIRSRQFVRVGVGGKTLGNDGVVSSPVTVGNTTPSNNFKLRFSEMVRAHGKVMVTLDKDGNLVKPHGTLTKEIVGEVIEMTKNNATVVITSGADISRAKTEVMNPLLEFSGDDKKALGNIFLLFNNGSQLYQYSTTSSEFEIIYRLSLEEFLSEDGDIDVGRAQVQKILGILEETRGEFPEIQRINDLIHEAQLAKKERIGEDEQIKNEESQIVLRVLGTSLNDTGFDKGEWDSGPNFTKRREYETFINERLAQEGIEVEVQVAGSGSINIMIPGVDKGYGQRKIAEMTGISHDAIVYQGDSLGADENDIRGVEGLVKLAIDTGKDRERHEIVGTILIPAEDEGPIGALSYLKIINEVLKAQTSSPIQPSIPGGIDFNSNNINLNEQSDKLQIKFSATNIQNLNLESITGILPVIINISPLPSVLPLLGLKPPKEKEFKVSGLN